MTDTEKLAADIFALALAKAEDLGSIPKKERRLLFRSAAELCFEAASAFMEVKHEKSS